jgi:hypothetical protein
MSRRQMVTMRELGRRGRFGNQLFQRSFVKAYAAEHGADWQVSPWVGEHLFGLSDPPVTAELPRYEEQGESGDPHRPVPPESGTAVGFDYAGYCQFPTAWWTHQNRVTAWRDYRPSAVWRDRLQPAANRLCHGAATVVGVHIRRGDYGTFNSPYGDLTPVDWYLDWLTGHWTTLPTPVRLFIATEDRELVKVFAEYRPETVESLGVKLKSKPYPHYNYHPEDLASGKPYLIDWFPEWWLLTQCDVILAANSTFPMTAAMVAGVTRRTPSFWRPSWDVREFVQESLWDCRPLRLDCPSGRRATA